MYERTHNFYGVAIVEKKLQIWFGANCWEFFKHPKLKRLKYNHYNRKSAVLEIVRIEDLGNAEYLFGFWKPRKVEYTLFIQIPLDNPISLGRGNKEFIDLIRAEKEKQFPDHYFFTETHYL